MVIISLLYRFTEGVGQHQHLICFEYRLISGCGGSPFALNPGESWIDIQLIEVYSRVYSENGNDTSGHIGSDRFFQREKKSGQGGIFNLKSWQ